MMLEAVSTLIRNRRSVKPVDMDLGRLVPEALVWQLLENGTWAPTHGLTEPWKFHVFAGGARERLAEALPRIYREVTPAGEVREDKLVKMGQNPLLAPVVIACCVEKRGGEKIPFLEEVEAVACAMQNVMLSATAAGLGSFWSSPPVLGSAAFGSWLGLGEGDLCVGLLYLGWVKDGRVMAEVPRRPVAEKVVWHPDTP
jgi:nitroreductase